MKGNSNKLRDLSTIGRDSFFIYLDCKISTHLRSIEKFVNIFFYFTKE